MSELFEDQASSLRRLLGGATLKSLVFIGGDTGVGQTALVANAARSLARSGHAVLVIDAQPQLRSGARWFGLSPRGDLAQAMAGELRLDDLLLHSAGGVTWLPAGRWRPGQRPAPACGRVLVELGSRFDTVLVDVPADQAERWWPSAARASAVLIGAGEQQRSVTAAYSMLKALSAQIGQQRYLWWAARAASPATAEAAFRKVAQTAQRFLQVQLGFAGALPADPAVPRAERLRRPVCEAFPASRYAAACAMLADLLSAQPRQTDPASMVWPGLLGVDPPAETRPHLTPDSTPDTAPNPVSDRTQISAPARTALVSR